MMSVLRWILFVPCAFLGAVIVNWLVIVLNVFTFSRYTGLDPHNELFQLFLFFISNLIMGASFVLIASSVAPQHKIYVAIVSCAIFGVLSGFALFPAILSSNTKNILALVLGMIGAIIVTLEKYNHPNDSWPFQ